MPERAHFVFLVCGHAENGAPEDRSSMKIVIGYLALAMGVATGLVGVATASRGISLGYVAALVAVPLVYGGYGMLRAPQAAERIDG